MHRPPMGDTMILDPTSPGLSLHAAQGLVDGLRGVLAGATCPQWTGVAGDSYRNQHGEVLACAQGVLDQIQAALSLVPAFDEERNRAFAHSLAAAVSQPELLALGAW